MKRFIRKLSLTTEILLVLTLSMGLFVWGGISQYLEPPLDNDTQFTNASLLSLAIVEIVLFAVVAPILIIRGWTASAIGLEPTAHQTLNGFLLAALGLAIFAVSDIVAYGSVGGAPVNPTLVPSPQLMFSIILGVSLVNAVYEEVFVAGYLISALTEKFSVPYAVGISALLRGSYHLYQGPVAAISIGVLGLAFALYYVRSKTLWPLVVAHTLLDIVAFVNTGPGS